MGDLLDLGTLTAGRRLGFRRGTGATTWYEQGCAQEAADPVRARASYERALAGRPDLADAHNNLGRLLHDRDDRAAGPHGADREARGGASLAESHYRLAICAAADVPLYWFNLGVSVEDQGRVSEAIAIYEHAIALDPCLADAHFNLARLLEVIGRKDADDLVLRRAVRHLVRYRDLARAG